MKAEVSVFFFQFDAGVCKCSKTHVALEDSALKNHGSHYLKIVLMINTNQECGEHVSVSLLRP